MIRIEKNALRHKILEEGIEGFVAGIIKQVDPAADVHEMAGMSLQQRANLFGKLAIARPDPFLAATTFQESAAQLCIRGGQKLPGQRIMMRRARRRCPGGQGNPL